MTNIVLLDESAKNSNASSLKIFENASFGEIRVAGTSEKPLFCLADLCKAVELSNPSSVKSRLDEEDVQLLDLHALNYTEGTGNTMANFVTESGFYDVILQSSSPKVKPFRKWVTSEVLPSIRKFGSYSVQKPKYSLEDKITWVKGVKEILNLNDVSTLGLLKKIGDPIELPLPDYVPSKGILKSATELLKQNGMTISAQAFNLQAIEKGYLETKTRNGSKGKKKLFKCITEKGKGYGENQVCPNNPNQTQPLWYEDKFKELVEELGFRV